MTAPPGRLQLARDRLVFAVLGAAAFGAVEAAHSVAMSHLALGMGWSLLLIGIGAGAAGVIGLGVGVASLALPGRPVGRARRAAGQPQGMEVAAQVTPHVPHEPAVHAVRERRQFLHLPLRFLIAVDGVHRVLASRLRVTAATYRRTSRGSGAVEASWRILASEAETFTAPGGFSPATSHRHGRRPRSRAGSGHDPVLIDAVGRDPPRHHHHRHPRPRVGRAAGHV